jgi:protein-S-isoprenylcysteine O-methyltransferase Ste14
MNGEGSTARILLNTIIFSILAPGGVTLGLPYLLLNSPLNIPHFQFDPIALRWLSIFLIITGFFIYLWCTADFVMRGRGSPNPDAAPTRLVVSGLYRYMRNPMYVGLLTVIVGEGLWVGSALLFLYAIVAFVIVHLRVLYYEEPTLLKLFGGDYSVYMKRVPRWGFRF